MKLKDKIVIVTGSASHIGKETALLFASEGAKLVITTRSNIHGGKKVVEAIKSNGGEAIFVQADLSNQGGVNELFDRTLETYQSLDILVNNAGVAEGKLFLESTLEDWKRDFDNNLFSMMMCSQKAAKIMQENDSDGVILNTTSVRGLESGGRPTIMGYSTAKAAAISFTKNLAKELAPNIRVNAVAPGFTLTANYDLQSDQVREFIESTQLKKWVQPIEIAEAFLYLATAKSVTGENMIVDAGFMLRN
mgnify:CR=1 FL=1